MAKIKPTLSVLLAMTIILVSCAQGNCRRKDAEIPKYPGQKDIIEGKTPVLTAEEKAKRMFVFKYDGSLQCGQGRPVEVEKMAEELAGVNILSQIKKPDGLMRIQRCGAPTGLANVYEIYKTDFTKAQSAGFEEWTFK